MKLFHSGQILFLRPIAVFWVALLSAAATGAQAPENIGRTLGPVYPPLAEQIVGDYRLSDRQGTGIDLGSGPGDLIIELCKRTRFMHWVNADIDSRVFPVFLQHAQEAGFRGRVSAIQADAAALPFHDAYADVVVSRGSYPFWKEKRKAFAEIYRVLKPGGVALVGRGFPESLPEDVAREIREKQRRSGSEPVYDVEKAAEELEGIMRTLHIEDYRIRRARRGDVNYGVWVEFHKPGKPSAPPSLMERPRRESAGLHLSTTVVAKAEVDAQGAKSVVDTLEFVPGAWVESRGRKVKQFVSFRGQKYPYPEYAIDGVLFREFHEVPYFLSTGEIQSVEVMRSGAAMLAGNAGLVGLINVVPRRYLERRTTVKAECGTFGTARATVSHGDRLGDFSYGFGFDGFRTDGPERRFGEERMANGYANMTWTPSRTFSLSTHLFHVGGSRGMVQALPPATKRLQAAVEGFDPVQTSFGTLNALYRPNDRLATQVLLGYSDRHNVAFATTAAGTTTTRDYDREFTAGATQSIAVSGSNTLRLGGNYNHWVAPYGKRFYAGRRSDLETYSVTLSDEQRIGRLIIDGGIRYHRTYINEYGAFNINEDAAPYRNVPSLKNQWEPAAMSATLGAAYSFNEQFSVHGNLAAGTVEPRRGTLTAALEPPRRERRVTGDIGFRVNKSRLGSATVSFFSVRREEGINLSGGIRTINGRVMEFYENRDQDSKGIEVDLRSRTFRNALQVFVNSMVMTARIDSGTAMLRDREMPRAISGAGVSFSRWRFDSNVFWKYVSKYQSSRFAEAAIAQPLGGFNAFDFTVGRRIGPRRQSRIYAEMKNVADNRYSTVVGYPDYGRRLVAGVEHSF